MLRLKHCVMRNELPLTGGYYHSSRTEVKPYSYRLLKPYPVAHFKTMSSCPEKERLNVGEVICWTIKGGNQRLARESNEPSICRCQSRNSSGVYFER